MLKKLFKFIMCFALILISGTILVACGNNDNHEPQGSARNDKAWFSTEELSARGLTNLPEPEGLTGEMTTYTTWFGNGYAFFQTCPSEEIFETNAEKYFNYFKTNLNGRFGLAKSFMYSNTETYYNIVADDNLESYYSTNPSKLYKLYFVTDTTLEDGYFKEGTVYSFDIRYEFNTSSNQYQLKIFIESEDQSSNGVFKNYYRFA